MLDNDKQTLQALLSKSYAFNFSIIKYVEDSQKLLKGRLVKPRRHVLGVHSPSTFQEELLGSIENYVLA